MNNVKAASPTTPPNSQAIASKARKEVLKGLFHTGMMIFAGFFVGRRIHPVAELVFYCFASIAAIYAVWQGVVAVRAAKAKV